MRERGEAMRNRPKVTATPGLTCILVTDGGELRVIARTGASADRIDATEIAQLAALLENAAAALRGQAADGPVLDSADVSVLAGDGRALRHFRIGTLEVHPESRLVLRAGQPVPLSRIEFDLFLALARRDGAPATRLELVREVWGFGAAVTSRSVDTQIYNLRHKLEENPSTPRHLLTVSGVGYRLAT